MPVKTIDLAPVGGGPDRRLPLLLEEGWGRGLSRGAIAYDPERAETLAIPPLQFILLPGRETRPREEFPPGARGLSRPHRPCPFDTPAFLAEREVLRVGRSGRTYHIALNKFPVLRHHFLAIRPAGDPEGTLPQRLFGPDEIEDMLLLARLLGPPYRLFFNSNQGTDGSRSGSSVNHWHFQVFPSESGIAARRPEITSAVAGVERGRVPRWPARHRLYRSEDPALLSAALWADLGALHRRDSAYNVEALPLTDRGLLALLFPRAPVPDLKLPGGNALSGDFGGFELSGGVVVPSRPIFEWIRLHPEEAVALMLERIRQATAELPTC